MKPNVMLTVAKNLEIVLGRTSDLVASIGD
jgi:hypothetical protein